MREELSVGKENQLNWYYIVKCHQHINEYYVSVQVKYFRIAGVY